jgi:hypothetical protein
MDTCVRRNQCRRAARAVASAQRIPGLEVVAPDEVERAATLFHRDGFVAVRDALPPDALDRLRDAAIEVIETLLVHHPRRREREAYRATQLAAMSAEAAAEHLRRA